jgi:Tfp pilus assembly protein PilF
MRGERIMSQSMHNSSIATGSRIQGWQTFGLRPTACFVLALICGACGGGAAAGTEAKTPTPTTAQTPQAGPPATGEQSSISDAPSSGEPSNRPKMNASAQQAYNAGMQAFQQGDLQGAKAQFSKAVAADAKAYQAFYSLGVVRERLGETSGALTSYRQATTIVPDYEPALAAYGVLMARNGKADEAAEFLSSRQAQMPKSAAVTAALAEVKSIQGDSGAAQRLAQEALKKNPDYRPAMVTLARDHYRARRLDLALYALKGILDGYGQENPPRDKNNGDARLIRGLIYKEQGLRGPAIEEFQKALQLRPDLVEARVQLAAYLLESGSASEAAQLLEGALRYDSQHLLAHLNLGDAYRLLGRPADAKRELELVLQRDPQLSQAHYNLGLLYLFSDNIPGVTPSQAADKAIENLELYKKKKPRGATGAPDDTEELITRAKSKKALVEAKAAEQSAAPAAPAAPPAAAGTAPAGTAPAGTAPGATAPAGAKPTAPATTTPAIPPAPAAGGKK